ncbi:MAG: FecR family protein [Saprospiraceae bacterium]
MTNDELLHKWINGEISYAELREFQQRPEYESLVTLYKNTESYAAPDFEGDKMLKKVLAQPKIQAAKPTAKRVSIFKWQRYAAAAAVLLAVGLFFWYQTSDSNISYQTAQTEIYNGELPDGSTFTLNAESQLTYDANNWNENRQLQLQGEAFFKVAKGKRFRVVTDNGLVQVLGTEFNVRSRANQLEVVCQEGKVAVLNTDEVTLKELMPKQAVRLENQQLTEQWSTNASQNWTDGIYRFRKVKLAEVIAEIERQHTVVVETNGIDLNEVISCNFPRENLEVALESCLVPLGIQYKIEFEKVILSK